jgi:hypothetical protein
MIQISNKQLILEKLNTILAAYEQGILQAVTMPEDERPELDLDSRENVHYYTFPMALNYQRNSYTLWRSSKQLYEDKTRNYTFDPAEVVNTTVEKLQADLLHYKVALQPNKHINTWFVLAKTFQEYYDCDVRNLFIESNYDIEKILQTIQIKYKKYFPYLSGHKIANYWLYVLSQYTLLPFENLKALSVAPDTHVIQASIKIGLIDKQYDPKIVAQLWSDLLKDTNLIPINIHTPLWLWSRNNFEFSKHANHLF